MSGQASKRRLAAPSFALGLGALAGLVLLAAPTRAARLVAVRVAQHPGFARVVFESDAAVAFDVEPPQSGAPVRVHLDASCAARTVSARGTPELSVQLEPAESGCIAVVNAPGPLRIEAQVLDRPPRVVLDLSPAPEAAHAPTAGEEPAAAPPPEPSASAREPAPPVPIEPPPPATPPPAPEASPVAPAPAESPPPATASEVPAPTPPAVEAPPPHEPVASEPAANVPVANEPAATPSEPAVSGSLEPGHSGSVGWDVRSLAVGLALGFLVGLLGSVVSRPRPVALPEPPAKPIAVEVATPAPPVAAPEPPPSASPGPPPDAELLSDLLAMFRGIDRRLAAIESSSEATREHCERFAAREAAHADELAAQRVALTRLDRVLRRPPPRGTESARSLAR